MTVKLAVAEVLVLLKCRIKKKLKQQSKPWRVKTSWEEKFAATKANPASGDRKSKIVFKKKEA